MPHGATLAARLDAIASGAEILTPQNLRDQYDRLDDPYQSAVRLVEGSKDLDRQATDTAIARIAETLPPSSLARFMLLSLRLRNILTDESQWDVAGGAPVPPARLVRSLEDMLRPEACAENPYLPIGRGILHFILGRTDLAYADFASARDNPWFWPAVRDDFKGAATCRPLPTLPALLDTEPTLPREALTWRTPQPRGSLSAVISYGCDDVYFRAFAPHVVRSVPPGAEPLALHFHVVNLSGHGEQLAVELGSLAAERGVELHLSTESLQARDRAYFASIRFLRLREFLDRFRAPVLQLDTDSEFADDPRRLLRGMVPGCVNMLFVKPPWGNGFLPWRRIWAGMVYTPADWTGRRFADVLRRTISYLWDFDREANWWIDQNALYVTYRLLSDLWGASGFHNVSDECCRLVRTSEELKIDRLREVAAVGALMAQGESWVSALRKVQLRDDSARAKV